MELARDITYNLWEITTAQKQNVLVTLMRYVWAKIASLCDFSFSPLTLPHKMAIFPWRMTHAYVTTGRTQILHNTSRPMDIIDTDYVHAHMLLLNHN